MENLSGSIRSTIDSILSRRTALVVGGVALGGATIAGYVYTSHFGEKPNIPPSLQRATPDTKSVNCLATQSGESMLTMPQKELLLQTMKNNLSADFLNSNPTYFNQSNNHTMWNDNGSTLCVKSFAKERYPHDQNPQLFREVLRNNERVILIVLNGDQSSIALKVSKDARTAGSQTDNFTYDEAAEYTQLLFGPVLAFSPEIANQPYNMNVHTPGGAVRQILFNRNGLITEKVSDPRYTPTSLH